MGLPFVAHLCHLFRQRAQGGMLHLMWWQPRAVHWQHCGTQRNVAVIAMPNSKPGYVPIVSTATSLEVAWQCFAKNRSVVYQVEQTRAVKQ